MAGEGQTQIPACLARESASIKRERALEKPEANRELAKAWELASHAAGVRVRSQSAREAFRWEHVKERGEGEAFAFRELRIRSTGGEKAWDCEAELLEARGELARRARRLRAHSRRSEKERRRGHERRARGQRRERLRGQPAIPSLPPWQQSSGFLPHAVQGQESEQRELRDRRSERRRSQSGEPDKRRVERKS